MLITTLRHTIPTCGSSRPMRPIVAGSSAASKRANGATRRSSPRTSRAMAPSAISSQRCWAARSKWGDSPSVGYLLHGTPEDPSQPGWGGQFIRAWERPHVVFQRLTGPQGRIEQFGVLELALSLGTPKLQRPQARLLVENQELIGSVDAGGVMRWRFSPKDAKAYRYTIRSNVLALDRKSGELKTLRPPPNAAQHLSSRLPCWWTDDPSPEATEGPHMGTRIVNRWWEDLLRDFAVRMDRCEKEVTEQEKIQRSQLASPNRLEASP